MRRIPGWPGDELHELLVRFKTPLFNPTCNGSDKIRRISDETVALNFSGKLCGECHVVS